ncbi:Crp/Fnr family transcriptional regulator [Aureibacter tunicatorum]|uniref:CRP/FNR family transcriptional regulator n=1 Tax=Aureibacter tunicatorum TaxID=866807 RepID=A0AAE3XQJ0_9BACT|nr:Crp/Fnr family transcriptional regulator [Aureibacter tunicatorum]MDR6240903.1 CRP/FNR family transcriptional regulator [Aureibacter tunicatorum]BDD03683.1 Crp/Fnr family transcriptional regulator [Aureibacter tunicatorum]
MATKKKINIRCENCESRNCSHFSDLSYDELTKLSDTKSSITYKKGQTLFYEGTRPLGLFCINSGKVKVYKMSADGKEHIISLGKPGDFLGYRALIGEEFYAASATVLEEATICYIPKTEFLNALQKNPYFFQRMTKALCHQVGVLEQKLITLAQKSVRERLALTLLMLKESYGMEDPDGGSTLIDIALSREDLSNIVGTATETVIRLLSEFKSDKMIAMQGKKIRVINAQALMKTADFYDPIELE